VGAAVQPVELEKPSAVAPAPERAAPRSAAEPLTADLRRLHVTVSTRFMEKLEAARDALSHSHSGADVEEILEAGLDLLLERAARRRGLVKKPCAQTRPRADAEPANPRHVPAEVSREVFLRDGGRCQWETSDGAICGSTHRVQLDHVIAVGRGGRSTVANLRVLCAFHNDLAARQTYGDPWMDQFTRRTKHPASPMAQAP
jgi:5-methylcytosine-specific restriction endonuclease McrA